MKKKLIITGASGFIGSYVLSRINRKDFEVFLFSRNKPKNMQNDDIWYRVDLADLDVVYKVVENIKATHLLHLAWYVKDCNYSNSFTNINCITWTINLVNAFIVSGGKHFVGAGTCFEYDLTTKEVLDIDSVCNPNTIYGKCKLETGNLIKVMCAQNGVRFVWGRIFYPYGVGEEQRKLFSAVINALKENNTFICKNPNDVIDYVYVEDVARAFCKLLNEEGNSGIVNICSGKSTNIKDVLQYIASYFKNNTSIVFMDNQNNKSIVAYNTIIREPSDIKMILKNMINSKKR